jgi:hypothetical protein
MKPLHYPPEREVEMMGIMVRLGLANRIVHDGTRYPKFRTSDDMQVPRFRSLTWSIAQRIAKGEDWRNVFSVPKERR